MSFEESITWEFLKNLADALDSYRIRALINAKQDILEAGIYNEDQYENILITMLDEFIGSIIIAFNCIVKYF